MVSDRNAPDQSYLYSQMKEWNPVRDLDAELCRGVFHSYPSISSIVIHPVRNNAPCFAVTLIGGLTS